MKYLLVCLIILLSAQTAYAQDKYDDYKVKAELNAFLIQDSMLSFRLIVTNLHEEPVLVQLSNWFFSALKCHVSIPHISTDKYNLIYLFPDKFEDIHDELGDAATDDNYDFWPLFKRIDYNQTDTLIINYPYNYELKTRWDTVENNRLFEFCNSRMRTDIIYFMYRDIARLLPNHIDETVTNEKEINIFGEYKTIDGELVKDKKYHTSDIVFNKKQHEKLSELTHFFSAKAPVFFYSTDPGRVIDGEIPYK